MGFPWVSLPEAEAQPHVLCASLQQGPQHPAGEVRCSAGEAGASRIQILVGQCEEDTKKA